MINRMLCRVSVAALATAMALAWSGQRGFAGQPAPAIAPSPVRSTESTCEASIQKLDSSPAEGEERLTEKRAVIDICTAQYRNDKAIDRLVKECAKYEEQPVVKQQFVAECQLAAFGYANALSTLKAQYGK